MTLILLVLKNDKFYGTTINAPEIMEPEDVIWWSEKAPKILKNHLMDSTLHPLNRLPEPVKDWLKKHE